MNASFGNEITTFIEGRYGSTGMLASVVWVRIPTQKLPSWGIMRWFPRCRMGTLIEDCGWCFTSIQWISTDRYQLLPLLLNYIKFAKSCLSFIGSVSGAPYCAHPLWFILFIALSLSFNIYGVPFVRPMSLVLTKGKYNSFSFQGTHSLIAENHSVGFWLLSLRSLVKFPQPTIYSSIFR